MSEKISCNIVQDLLPSYIDDLCSDESREIVEKHIKECEICREMLSSMKEDMGISNKKLNEKVTADEKKINLEISLIDFSDCELLNDIKGSPKVTSGYVRKSK